MPNTAVRAAAEGMPNVNRRRLLIGAGATAATLAATSLPAAPADHPDAALFALEKEMNAAARIYQRALNKSSRTDKKAVKAAAQDQ